MKVLKVGSIPTQKSWGSSLVCIKRDQFDGNGCGAKLSVKEKDLLHYFYRGTHFAHSYPAIKCPLCGKINCVKDVPASIKEKLFKRKGTFDGFEDR